MNTENKDIIEGVLSPTTGLQEPIQAAISANFLAEYESCLTCKDLGKNCKGPKLAALGTIANVREYHRRLRSSRGIQMKQIFPLTRKEISDASVKDYFSHEEKDFRWATVSLIDNALTVICGDCVGLPPVYIPNCPATSSEIKEKIESVTAELNAAKEECATLQEKIIENESKHMAQLDEFRKDQSERADWLKSDVRLWRKIAFSLLGVLVITIIAFVAYIILNLAL